MFSLAKNAVPLLATPSRNQCPLNTVNTHKNQCKIHVIFIISMQFTQAEALVAVEKHHDVMIAMRLSCCAKYSSRITSYLMYEYGLSILQDWETDDIGEC